MKSRTKVIIIAVVVLIAAVIAILAIQSPRVLRKNVSGTFAKAEKYNKQASTQKDVLLRTELTQDTVRLRSMIRSLLTIEQYNTKLSQKIDTIMQTLKGHPIMYDPKLSPPMLSLKKFGSWLVTSNASIKPVTDYLVRLYLHRDSVDQSVDIDNELRVFVRFISQLSVRDSIMGNAARAIDQYLTQAEKKKLPAEEMAQLKGIRNQLLASNLLASAMLGNKKSFEKLITYVSECDARDQATEVAQLVKSDYYVIRIQYENAIVELGNNEFVPLNVVTENAYDNLSSHDQPGMVYDLDYVTAPEAYDQLNIVVPQAYDQLNDVIQAYDELSQICIVGIYQSYGDLHLYNEP